MGIFAFALKASGGKRKKEILCNLSSVETSLKPCSFQSVSKVRGEEEEEEEEGVSCWQIRRLWREKLG